jgi:hypothetical protein
MRSLRLSELEARLLAPPEPGRFSDAELAGLPEPARRHLAQAIAPGTPLASSAQLRMRGRIKVGRWLPFRARQVLNPHRGFVWAARAAGVIAGSDRHLDGDGGMDWKLAGLVIVAHAQGPDVSRSAAGRAGAEAIWLPTALLPSFGVRWSAAADDQVTAHIQVGDTPVELRLRLDAAGRIASLVFDRWGDPDNSGAFAWHRFGGEVTGYRSFQGLTIPSEGRLGWFYGQDRWPAGEFFRYQITDLQPVTGPAAGAACPACTLATARISTSSPASPTARCGGATCANPPRSGCARKAATWRAPPPQPRSQGRQAARDAAGRQRHPARHGHGRPPAVVATVHLDRR